MQDARGGDQSNGFDSAEEEEFGARTDAQTPTSARKGDMQLTPSQMQQQKNRKLAEKRSSQAMSAMNAHKPLTTLSREDRKNQQVEKLFEKLEGKVQTKTSRKRVRIDNVDAAPDHSQTSSDNNLNTTGNGGKQQSGTSANGAIKISSPEIIEESDDAETGVKEQNPQPSEKNLSPSKEAAASAVRAQKRRSDQDPVNNAFNFGDQGNIFFYLFDYQEQEKQKQQDLEETMPKRFEPKGAPLPPQDANLRIGKHLLDETVLVYNKILKKFQDQKKDLAYPFSKTHSDFQEQYITQQHVQMILRPHASVGSSGNK